MKNQVGASDSMSNKIANQNNRKKGIKFFPKRGFKTRGIKDKT